MLAKQANPFAIVIWAYLEALETRKDAHQRFQSKMLITRALYKRGFNREYILNLLTFIDWVLALPEPLEIEYNQEIKRLEGEESMRYITSFERIGMQKGEAAIILRQLQRRFGKIPKAYKQRIVQADAKTLLTLGDKILDAKTLEDLFEEE